MSLIEAMIASAVLSVVMIISWQLFRTGARSAEMSGWHTRSQQQLRNGLRQLRDDIGHASYPSVVTPTSVTISSSGHAFRFHPGKVTLTEDAGETSLLDFYICKPRRKDFNDGNDFPGETIHATVMAKGNKVHYVRDGSLNSSLNGDKVIFDQVDWIAIDGPSSAPAEKSTTCSITVKTIHTVWKQTGVLEQTMPKVDVEVKGDL